jgi:hypothetical protein
LITDISRIMVAGGQHIFVVERQISYRERISSKGRYGWRTAALH